MHAHGSYYTEDNTDIADAVLLGVNTAQRYGVPLLNGVYAFRDQHLIDNEVAGYGELNYYLTSKLKLTAGLRVSRVGFKYDQTYAGPINNSNNPATVAGGITAGDVNETPITPKFGAQYQINNNDQVYVSAAKGYRAGGINSPLSQSQCGVGLAQYNLSVNDIPQAYSSDSIWSYEAGAKGRFFNRLQVNAAVYDIEWTNLQTTVSIPSGCQSTWVQNVGSARSRGVELEAQARLFEGFSLNVGFSYDHAYYTTDVVGPTPSNGGAAPVFFYKGQTLGQSPWQLYVGGQYNFSLRPGVDGFIRGDVSHTPDYTMLEFGDAGYSPDIASRMATTLVNMRAGVTKGPMEFELFVNNLFESRDGSVTGGRTGCVASSGAACTNFTTYTPFYTLSTFRPREIGLQFNYRY